MNSRSVRRTAALFLIVVPLLFMACFTLLQAGFEYPDILRRPAGEVLRKFQAGGAPLIATWYLLTLSAVLFAPVALLVHRVLAEARAPWPGSGEDEAPAYLAVGTTFGVLAALVQTLGFLRWPFLVPYLARVYLSPSAGEAERAAVVVVFEAFQRYAGMGMGEHLGYLFTAVWTVAVAATLLRRHRSAWLGVPGLLLAAGIAAGLLEPAGWAPGGTVNAFAYMLWALWLVALGVTWLIGARGVRSRSPEVIGAAAPR